MKCAEPRCAIRTERERKRARARAGQRHMHRATCMCWFFIYVWRLLSGTGSTLQRCGIQLWLCAVCFNDASFQTLYDTQQRALKGLGTCPQTPSLTGGLSSDSLCDGKRSSLMFWAEEKMWRTNTQMHTQTHSPIGTVCSANAWELHSFDSRQTSIPEQMARGQHSGLSTCVEK